MFRLLEILPTVAVRTVVDSLTSGYVELSVVFVLMLMRWDY